MTGIQPVLSVRQMQLQAGKRVLCESLDLTLLPGQRLAVLGQNGSGKTSLLHSLLKLRKVNEAGIELEGRTLDQWSRKELAQAVGILFQDSQDDMPATVQETAMLGRLPHLSGWRWESAHDIEQVRSALCTVGLDDMFEREISTLSGGERQRLAIACLLAQSPRLYLLDEPSNHLDISFQIKTLKLLSTTVAANNSAMVMATHDINLAARFCDQTLLLFGDGQYTMGDTWQVLSDSNLSRAYECSIQHVDTATGRLFFPSP